MARILLRGAALALMAAGWISVACGCGCSCADRQEATILVFHSASLSKLLSEVQERFEGEHPGVQLRLEPSESVAAARKVSELNRPCDLLVVDDARVIERLLVPDHARQAERFAANEVVLAYGEHSPFTETLTAQNWAEVLSRPEVRLGRANEQLSPLGEHTLLLWQLAEGAPGPGAPGLAERLKAKVAPGQLSPDASGLVSHLESRTIDYAFLHRNTAEEHNLKVLRLPPEINLSRPDLAGRYARAEIEIASRPGQERRIRGGTILLGLCIPVRAPNPVGGRQVQEFLLGPRGQAALKRDGLVPLEPAP